jgi:ribonuclease P protein component
VKGEQHLTKAAQFAQVFSRGDSLANKLIVMKTLPNGLTLSRYGLSVGRRVGGAVVRNRAKRLLREIMRLTQLKPGWDIVLITRTPAAGSRYGELEKAVKDLLGRAQLLSDEYEKACLRTN